MRFLHRVAGIRLRDRVRSGDIQMELGVQPLFLRIESIQQMPEPPGCLHMDVFWKHPEYPTKPAATATQPQISRIIDGWIKTP